MQLDLTHFTPISSLLGGVLIGVASAAVLFLQGKVAGISGILGNLLSPQSPDKNWRAAFVLGLLLSGLLARFINPSSVTLAEPSPPLLTIALAGLLVGYGTRLGNGCTSGHGVCGISRLSRRSLSATGIFMTTAALTVVVVDAMVGGAQ